MSPRTKGKAASDPMQLEIGRSVDTRAHARRKDPATSQAAAMDVTNLRASQARVLQMFKLYGDLEDKQLTRYLHEAERAAGMRPMSVSGVRSRRSELAKPNMDRLDEMAREFWRYQSIQVKPNAGFAELSASTQDRLRRELRREGFRSPLWDTGKRVIVDGRSVIVWGLAV